jgi:hypothetical protein
MNTNRERGKEPFIFIGHIKSQLRDASAELSPAPASLEHIVLAAVLTIRISLPSDPLRQPQRAREHLLGGRATHIKEIVAELCCDRRVPGGQIGSVCDERHGDLRIVRGQARKLAGMGRFAVKRWSHPLCRSGPSWRKSASSGEKEARPCSVPRR